MLSNHNTKFINELYKGFHITVVPAKRMINSNSKGRGAISELVITNYEESIKCIQEDCILKMAVSN